MSGKFLPGEPAVSRFEEAASRSATLTSPGMNLERPHACEQDARIGGIHRDIRTTAVLIGEKYAVPGLATISRAKHTAFLLRAICVPECASEHNIRVAWIDYYATDATGFFKAHQAPRFAGISGFVNALA